MLKRMHEVRDPIHAFVYFDSDERRVINSRPFQRLRHIHQLAMTHLVYPGATHRRFEHSLGVMELASRAYDIVTHPNNIMHERVADIVPEWQSRQHQYWRLVLRMAALCHDMGHVPFSHAAEDELLPEGWKHERLTIEMIRSDELRTILEEIKVDPEDVAKIAVGAKKYHDAIYSEWEAILAELIVGDAFGVDRIDYLLRDCHHAGVAYGKFDHYRLIDTMRVLPRTEGDSMEPTLGVEEGGLHSAEQLLLARYFMFTQVYCHPVRRIYDIHLKDFLRQWLDSNTFPTSVEEHLRMTDNEVTAGLLAAARDEAAPGHDAARRIVERQHFRVLYQRNPEDQAKNLEAAKAVFQAAEAEFGQENVRHDKYIQEESELDFPVLSRRGRIVSSAAMSETLRRTPLVAVEYVFISPDRQADGDKWLESSRERIMAKGGVETA